MSEKNIVFTKLSKVEKIIHLADIHIRLYKRHAEYLDVFETLYADIKKRDLKNTAIVVAGDIVHAKTDMSPEMVRVASEFLKNLADLAPTIIIAGNHDLNLSNLNRLDALSPIVDNLNHKNLYYFKDSGVYEFADVEFGVHSIIGLAEEWPSPVEMTAGTKIALYHGPVNNAKTDGGFSVTNRVTPESFVGYDMVLLGDIHKAQLLQESAPGKPEIMYPGSLIQQNHGEAVSGHGYAVWDVATSKAEEYVEIKNSHGYYTLTLTDKKMPDISNLPENVRLRIFAGDVDSTVVKMVQAAVRKQYTVIECVVSKLIDKSKSNASISGKKNVLDDIQDVNHQNTLIKDYIENHFPSTSEDIIEKIFDVNSRFNSRIGEDELPKNISWKPIKMKFDNLFSYGEGNEIEFEDMTGLYGIFSPNATGKSSAFDALCFALYDKTPRAFKGSHIMNTRKDSFSCELEIDIDGTRFIIERVGSRKKNAEVKVDVNFYKVEEDDSRLCLNGEDRRDTNAAIRSYVGTYEDFVLTTLSVQNQNSLFIDTGQSDRKDLLSQFIGLTIFDRLFNLASDEIKEVAGALKSFKRDDFTQKLADVQRSLETELVECDTLETSVQYSEAQIEEIVQKTNELYSQKHPNVPVIDVAAVEKKRVHVEALLGKAIEEYQKAQDAHETFKNEHQEVHLKFSQTASQSEQLLKEFDVFQRAKVSIVKLKNQLDVLSVGVKSARERMDRSKNSKFDPNCSFCVQNNQVLVEETSRATKEHDTLSEQRTKLEQNVFDGEQFIVKLGDIEGRYNEAQQLGKRLGVLDAYVARTEASLEKARRVVEDKHDDIAKLDAMMSEYTINSQLIKQNKLITDQITMLNVQKADREDAMADTRIKLQSHFAQVQVLKTRKDEMIASLKEAEELETTYDAYETYLSVIGRDGLPYELITQIIPSLESEVNNILVQIVDFSISMNVDGKNINGRIVYEDDRTWPLELASGMEKFITSLAIRVALMTVSNLPKSNFLIIDEGLGVLDADNLASMGQLFNILKNQFDFIILISHLDVVRDIADNLIEIKREDGFSHISVK